MHSHVSSSRTLEQNLNVPTKLLNPWERVQKGKKGMMMKMKMTGSSEFF